MTSLAKCLQQLDEACEFLRGFTLGQRGFTQRDGISGIERVSNFCQGLEERFGSGAQAKEISNVVHSARNQILAGKARLALLQKRTAQ